MAIGEPFLRAFAWLSLFAWAASEWQKSTSAPGSASERRARAWFTAGAIALLAHSALAFHLRYAWSHAAAAQDTARQTRDVTGLAFGGGVFVNELFLVVWLLAALWWWLDPEGYRSRGPSFEWPLRASFLVMFVSGAVVFARGPVRLAGAAAVGVVLAAWYRGAGRGRSVGHG
ncbi:MAG TPA: hypothetical protein VFK70_15355 [Vicinamibacteria bacterium]|nr:hypothetical protein [Vicinamibacteria bacterium]